MFWYLAIGIVLAVVAGLFAAVPPLLRQLGPKPAAPQLMLHSPPLELSDLRFMDGQGAPTSLSAFRGRVVLLNVWATWCSPCREEMPGMEKLYQEYKQKNFVVLAVAVKDRKQEAIDFVKELKLTYPIALDPDAQVGSLYGAWGLPATYLIGPKGEGLARGWGPADWYAPPARKLIQSLVDGQR